MPQVDLHEVYLAHRSKLHNNFFFLQSLTFHNIKIKISFIKRHHPSSEQGHISPWSEAGKGGFYLGRGGGGGGVT